MLPWTPWNQSSIDRLKWTKRATRRWSSLVCWAHNTETSWILISRRNKSLHKIRSKEGTVCIATKDYNFVKPYLWRRCINILKEKSKVSKYAKWPSKWLTNESLVWDLMKLKKMNFFLCWFLIDFIFCRLAETAASGSPSVTWLSRKWRQSGESVRLPS